MDIVFKCSNCDQELAVDASAIGSEIQCPACGEVLIIPEATAENMQPSAEAQTPPPQAARPAPPPEVKKNFAVPQHSAKADVLIEKAKPTLEQAAKDPTKVIRVKTIRRSDCMEVGHDHFDEVSTKFLQKIGEENVVSITALNYSHLEVGSQKLITDYGIMIVYKG